MNNIEFASKLKDIATNYKTVYALGTFGWPTNKSNVNRAVVSQTYNKNRQSMLEGLSSRQ